MKIVRKIKDFLGRNNRSQPGKDALYTFYEETGAKEKERIYKKVIEATNKDQQEVLNQFNQKMQQGLCDQA